MRLATRRSVCKRSATGSLLRKYLVRVIPPSERIEEKVSECTAPKKTTAANKRGGSGGKGGSRGGTVSKARKVEDNAVGVADDQDGAAEGIAAGAQRANQCRGFHLGLARHRH